MALLIMRPWSLNSLPNSSFRLIREKMCSLLVQKGFKLIPLGLAFLHSFHKRVALIWKITSSSPELIFIAKSTGTDEKSFSDTDFTLHYNKFLLHAFPYAVKHRYDEFLYTMSWTLSRPWVSVLERVRKNGVWEERTDFPRKRLR